MTRSLTGGDFQRVFDATPNPYMVLDASLRFVAANAAYLAITGSRLEELLGRHIFDVFPHDPHDPENDNARQLEASFARVLDTKERDVLALIHYRVPSERGGAPRDRWWSATHTPILGPEGDVDLIVQHTVDVTEVERLRSGSSDAGLGTIEAGIFERAKTVQSANVTLGRELRRLRLLYEQAPNFVCILRGPTHIFELVNAAYRKLVGHRDLQGLTVREALPEVAGQGFFELLDRVYTTAEPFIGSAVEIMLQRVPGGPHEEAILDFIYHPITDVDGTVVGIFVQGNDITSERAVQVERDRLFVAEQKARAEAERANRLKDEFLATVSHELRTPLTSILGWLQLLRGQQLEEERRVRALETIERNGRALAQLVDDILDVSRIMSGKLKLEVEPVHVADAVSAAIESVRPAADAKNIQIRATLDPSAVVMGDAGRLQQIVWNLLTNAVKFSDRRTTVIVLVEIIDASVVMTVRDEGRGIDEAFLPHVFERFRQAEGGSSRRHGGLGLGLSIVKHLVELHGGTVTASSSGEHRGSTFRTSLPVSLVKSEPRGLATPITSVGRPNELEGLRILVVEDEKDTRDLLQQILTHCGAKVEMATCAADALAIFEREPPALVISDIGMPGEDGLAFIRKIRSLPPAQGGRVPAIALTAFARTEDRTHALRSGFRAHVPKPIDVGELLAVIGALAAP